MPILSYVAIYFVLWWLCLFLVLPFGVHSQSENEDVTAGSEPGAPAAPRMLTKIVITTLLAAVVMALSLWALSNPVLQEYWR